MPHISLETNPAVFTMDTEHGAFSINVYELCALTEGCEEPTVASMAKCVRECAKGPVLDLKDHEAFAIGTAVLTAFGELGKEPAS